MSPSRIRISLIAIGIALGIGLYLGINSRSRHQTSTPENALEVTIIGHQFWWELRYPQLGIVTANELRLPAGTPDHPVPATLTIGSADTVHTLWTPPLIPSTDADPNHSTTLELMPTTPGIFSGQCPRSCETRPPMLLRVIVQTPTEFSAWAAQQRQLAMAEPTAAHGRSIFEHTACISCHRVAGTPAAGIFGPDLTHIATRTTLAAGATPNTPGNLRAFIDNPATIKPGVTMPALHLSPNDLDAVTAYLETLK
jgi:cytochrome c oxidase subunit 2